jgi:GntR family histidine utilization transcriptional repressor
MRDEPLPHYLRLKRMIVERIETGDWPPHHRIPSESELVREFGVSRMTINRAVRELAIEGKVVRVQGVGTFVAEPKTVAALFEVRNIAEEIGERGRRHGAQVLLLREEQASGEVARALGLRPGQPVFHSLLLHSEDGIPVQLEDRFVVPAMAPEYLRQDFTRITPYVYLTQSAPISQAEHEIEAVLANAGERRHLKITPGEPCLSLRRLTWSGGRPVSVVRLLYPGSRYRLSGRLNAGQPRPA